MSDESALAPFWDHVAELQRTVLLALGTIVLGVVLCFCFYQQIFQFFTRPLEHSLQQGPLAVQELKRTRITNSASSEILYVLKQGQSPPSYLSEGVQPRGNRVYNLSPGSFLDLEEPIKSGLVIFSPIEGMLIALKVCFWCGVVFTSPLWAFLLLRFILPALRPQEHALIAPFLGLSILFIGLGLLLAYFVTIPIANAYLLAFNASVGVNLWSLSSYLDYTLFLLLANVVAFELAVILFFLVHLKIISAQMMSAKRRHMIVAAFVLGALLTPPDVLTQLMLAIPLIGLYELILVYARLRSAARG
jgi:sec-independent protein translocase protein TatC